jgi:hypothetical protein
MTIVSIILKQKERSKKPPLEDEEPIKGSHLDGENNEELA